MRVLVRDQQRQPIDRQRLRRIARRAVELEEGPREAELSVLLTDDSAIRELNRRYRGVDAATDVLAFPQPGDAECAATRAAIPNSACDTPAPQGRRFPVLLGDVVISVETAQRQAAQRRHSLDQELGILLAHGVLHLLGWDDATPQQRRRMLKRGCEVLDSL